MVRCRTGPTILIVSYWLSAGGRNGVVVDDRHRGFRPKRPPKKIAQIAGRMNVSCPGSEAVGSPANRLLAVKLMSVPCGNPAMKIWSVSAADRRIEIVRPGTDRIRGELSSATGQSAWI